MEDPYSPPQSRPVAAIQPARPGFVRRSLYAARWYLFALAPAVIFGALAFFHAYRAAHMQSQGNLLLSPDEINGSADLLFISGIIISACLLAMVIINDIFSLAGRLIKRVFG